jgi:hypothetical protein
LAEGVAERRMVALVDDQHAIDPTGAVVRVGETISALAVLEGREGHRAERVATAMARIGLEARPTGAQVEAEGRRMAAVAEELSVQLGHDWAQESTRRAAQRAVLAVWQREHEARRP